MTIKRVGILGSGIMGSGIAEVAAKTGHEVVLRSRKKETADAMVASLGKSLAKQVERGKLSQEDADATLARVTATDHIGAVADCDLVIESVVEDMDVKWKPFVRDPPAELDSLLPLDQTQLEHDASTRGQYPPAVAPDQAQQALLAFKVPGHEIAVRAVRAEKRCEPFVERDVHAAGGRGQGRAVGGLSGPDRALDQMNSRHA